MDWIGNFSNYTHNRIRIIGFNNYGLPILAPHRFEDGPQITRHYKLWLPTFIGTEKRNYAVECVNVIANLTADFPKHLSYIATHNRTINTRGKVGHGKPIDQMVEHYNL